MRTKFYLLLAALFSCTHSHAQLITTVAGNGTSGTTGDGGPATAAEISGVYGIAFDPAGNMYLADYGANRVRKVSAAGIISTFAGTGSSSTSGDGGPASAASLAGPIGVAADALGNIYISEYLGGNIRKVNSSGVISTFMSGLGNPTGLCTDAANNLYIAEQTSHTVAKVTPGGAATIVAGNGGYGYSGDGGAATAATLSDVTGVSVDPAGNLYLSCWDEQHVRKVNTSGIITTIAGNGAAGYSGDGGPATAAMLSQPYDIKADAAGNVYIADVANSRVRRVDAATGIITTFAGTGVTGFNGDGIPATSANVATSELAIANGKLYLNDGPRIRVVPLGMGGPAFAGGHSQSLTVCENSAAASLDTLLRVSDSTAGHTDTWTVITGASHGTLAAAYTATSTGSTITPTGLSYTPATGFSGTDSFKIKVSDGSNTDSTTVHVVINPLPNAGVIAGATSVCVSGSVTLSDAATGGAWSATTGHASVGGTTGVVTGISAGTDTVKYTVTNSCGSSAAVMPIAVDAAPNAGAITGPAAVCAGDSVALADTISGGTWSRANPNVSVSATGMVRGRFAGTDTVRYTVINGCGTAIAEKAMTVNPAPNAGRITGPTGMCLGDTMRVGETVTGGSWYVTNGVATISGGLVTSVSVGRDTVLYTISNSCGSDTARRTINIGTPPAPIPGPNHLCQGDTATLTDADGGGSWSSSSFRVAAIIPTTSIVTAIGAGTATISYTVGGCSATMVLTVHALPATHTITGGGHFCPSDGGAPVALNGSNSGVVYYLLWGGAALVDSLPGTGSAISFGRQPVPGTYTVMAINPLTGCHRNMTGTDTVIQDTAYIPVVHITATPGTNVAAGQPVTLHANNTNAGASPTYQWVVGGTYIGGATSKTYTSSSFADGDSVSCFVTSYGICGSYTSENFIIMHVHPAGVQQVNAEGGFSIYPNPGKGSFTFSLASAFDEQATIVITDILGKEQRRFSIESNKQANFNLGLLPGLYIVTGVTEHERYQVKLVVD